MLFVFNINDQKQHGRLLNTDFSLIFDSLNLCFHSYIQYVLIISSDYTCYMLLLHIVRPDTVKLLLL